jgi:hypothetical protein
MAKGDRRNSLKMRRIKAQKAKKAREKAKREAKAAGSRKR